MLEVFEIKKCMIKPNFACMHWSVLLECSLLLMPCTQVDRDMRLFALHCAACYELKDVDNTKYCKGSTYPQMYKNQQLAFLWINMNPI